MKTPKTIPRKKADAQALGQHAEALVAAWLIEQGATIKVQNYRCRRGEIDLIVEFENVLTFVEVRALSQADPARALASITPTKQRRIMAAAQHYLARNPPSKQFDIGFECVGVSYQTDGSILCLRYPMELW